MNEKGFLKFLKSPQSIKIFSLLFVILGMGFMVVNIFLFRKIQLLASISTVICFFMTIYGILYLAQYGKKQYYITTIAFLFFLFGSSNKDIKNFIDTYMTYYSLPFTLILMGGTKWGEYKNIMKNTNKEIFIPVYLDENKIKDYFSFMEDGFYSEYLEIDNSKDLDGDLQNNKNNSNINYKTHNKITNKNKVYTLPSLFNKVYYQLKKTNSIKQIEEINFEELNIKEGDLIEIEGIFEKSFSTMLTSLLELLKFTKPYLNSNLNQNKNKKNKTEQEIGYEELERLLLETLDIFQNKGNIKMICNINNCKCIVPININYLNNLSVNELSNNKYKILCKITKINNDENNEINLLDDTSLNILTKEYLESFFNSFSNDETKSLINVPEINIFVKGEYIQVIPICIYR